MLRQVLSSANYRTGGDVNDFFSRVAQLPGGAPRVADALHALVPACAAPAPRHLRGARGALRAAILFRAPRPDGSGDARHQQHAGVARPSRGGPAASGNARCLGQPVTEGVPAGHECVPCAAVTRRCVRVSRCVVARFGLRATVCGANGQKAVTGTVRRL
eukprot:4240507-Prymnesium_polylepis.1